MTLLFNLTLLDLSITARSLFSITMNLRQVITSFLLLNSNFGNVFGESYIPAYIEGTPLTGQVVGNAPADLRDKPLFRIEHKVL